MGQRFLLDTNIVADYFNKKANIRTRFEEVIGQDIPIYTSAITIGELCYGAYKSQKIEQNLEQIYQLVKLDKEIASFTVQSISKELLMEAKRNGKPKCMASLM